jgi:hypothetical protein
MDEIAMIVPEQCPDLSERQLQHCFQKLFDIRTDGGLEPRFRETYRKARSSLGVEAGDVANMTHPPYFKLK